MEAYGTLRAQYKNHAESQPHDMKNGEGSMVRRRRPEHVYVFANLLLLKPLRPPYFLILLLLLRTHPPSFLFDSFLTLPTLSFLFIQLPFPHSPTHFFLHLHCALPVLFTHSHENNQNSPRPQPATSTTYSKK